MDQEDRIRGKGDSGRCVKQRSRKVYSRKRKNPNKGKKLQPKATVAVVDVAEVEQTTGAPLLHATTALDNNNDTDNVPVSTISTTKVIDIETDGNTDNLLTSGFRLLDKTILALLFGKMLAN